MVEEEEIVMTTLNGFPRDWESFILGIGSRRKITKFPQLWEEFVQEEEIIEAIEYKLNENEDQALAVHTKGKKKRKSYDRPLGKYQGFKKSKKDFSNYGCFTCHKMGHIAIKCPMKAGRVKKMKRFQAHVTEDSDQEFEEEVKKDEDSNEEYVLIFALIRSISPQNDTCLVDSGASNHMTGYKDSLSCLVQKESPHKVMLGDDSQYPIK